MISVKRLAVAVFSIVCTCLGIPAVLAATQSYPTQPVHVIVAWPAGGLVDICARVVGQELEKSLKQRVIVEDQAGAGGIIAANAVAKATPDGYTVLATTSALDMNAALRPHLFQFDIHNGLEPIVVAATTPSVLVATPTLPVHSVKELIAYAKAHPGRTTFGSAGVGTPAHFAGVEFERATGIESVHVPFKGAPPLMNAQIAGEITFHFANYTVALPQIKAGTVRALAITSATRSKDLPNVPTMEEAGVPHFVVNQWVGYFAPRGTPKSVIDTLAHAINRALASPHVQKLLEKSGMTPMGTSNPDKFAQFLQTDLDHYKKLIKAAHISVE